MYIRRLANIEHWQTWRTNGGR